MTELPARRLLLVHAHPDDESIGNGATMAKYAAEGALVTLVTCTLGEEGEVIPPGLAHLAADRDDTLGPYRAGELAAAMRELGVTDHRFLGGPGRFRDSGMAGLPQNDRPGALWGTPPEAAAPYLVEIVREVRPQVLVTYDPDGGYGHPDHVRAHGIAVLARALAADPAYRPDLGEPHLIAQVFWNCLPRERTERELRRLRAQGGLPFPAVATADDLPGVVDDAVVTTVIDGTPYADRKAAAMRAHATQIAVDGPCFALSNGLAQPLSAEEFYRSAGSPAGDPGGAGGAGTGPGGRPDPDGLFAGLGV